MRTAFHILIILVCFSCQSRTKSSTYNRQESGKTTVTKEKNTEETNDYQDGEYCATVSYFNPNTGTHSTYQLTVEIENKELTRINWPNGGWLDESHFTAEELDDNGFVTFTSDRGYNYAVQIVGSTPCNYISPRAISPAKDEENQKKHVGEEEGTVIWEHLGCDYVIIETQNGWYVVAEKGVGAFLMGQGSRVRGNLITFGSEDVYSFSDDDEISIYIDNYYGSRSRALEKVIEKCGLEEEKSVDEEHP